MLLRGFFWIAVIAVLMPREPDLGFGRPGGISLPPILTSWMQSGAAARDICKDREADCAGGIRTLDQLQDMALRGLAEVKAEIEADKRARKKAHAG